MRFKIFIIAILCLSVSACKKSFLEIPAKTALSTTVFFTSQQDFEQAINGAYAPLRSLYSGTYGAYVMAELRSDNTTYKYNPSDRGTIQAEFIKDFTDDSSNPVTLARYSNNYAVIARVNQILDQIDPITFDTNVKNNIKGQAYLLRAFCYFDLVQFYGSVPLHLKPAKTLDETALPLSTVDQIYAQIIADAQQGATLLPPKATQEPGRVTSGTANTLLGNVYIVQKKWADAETALRKVTGYSLLPNYADVFDPTRKNNAESIFEIQYKEGNEGLNSNFFYTFLPQPITASEVSAITGITEVARTIEGYNIPTPDIIAAYEANDSRKAASVGTLTANGTPYPYIKKYAHAHALTNNTGDNWPVYRYAEVLLFLAEAANEQGRPGDAQTFLNQVRTRAGLPATTAGTQAALRDAIFQERRVELAFENKRWLDLVRNGTAQTVMTAYGARVKANPQAYYFPAGITVSPQSYTNIRLLFPLPAAEAALSPYF